MLQKHICLMLRQTGPLDFRLDPRCRQKLTDSFRDIEVDLQEPSKTYPIPNCGFSTLTTLVRSCQRYTCLIGLLGPPSLVSLPATLSSVHCVTLPQDAGNKDSSLQKTDGPDSSKSNFSQKITSAFWHLKSAQAE